MRTRPRRLAALAIALAASCGPRATPTEVVVALRGNASLEGATVDVTVHGADGDRDLPRQLLSVASLPLEISIVPVGGDASRRFVLDVRVQPTTGPLRSVRLRGAFVADRLIRSDVWLTPPPLCGSAVDAQCTVRPRSPQPGAYTGSVHAAGALRPTFRWQALPAPGVRYELELDGSCAAVSPDLCPFVDPIHVETTSAEHVPDTALEVSRAAPVGRRYVWRVRACDSAECTMWSEPRVLEVGRQRTDFDGDGYADIVAGAENATVGPQFGHGLVFRWPGGPDVTALGTPQRLDAGDCVFGDGVGAIGDSDGDGFPDLAVSAPRGPRPCIVTPPPGGAIPRLGGTVYLYYGSAAGLVLEADATILSPETETVRFGTDLSSAGDLDRDGLADLAIPGGDRLFLHVGREDRRLVSWAELPNPAEQPNSSCCADVDRDGRADLLVARDGGVALLSDGVLAVIDAPTVNPGEMFSFDVAMPDLDGDGDVDLVAGSCSNTFTPEIGNTWTTHDPDQPFTPLGSGPIERSSGFHGCFVSTFGDVDGDGRGDFGSAGAFTVGTAGTATDGQTIAWLDDATRGIGLRGVTPDTARGRDLAGVGDIDGDGFDDVVANAGRIMIDACSCPAGGIEIWRGGAAFGGSPNMLIENPEPTQNADIGLAIAEAYP